MNAVKLFEYAMCNILKISGDARYTYCSSQLSLSSETTLTSQQGGDTKVSYLRSSYYSKRFIKFEVSSPC
jgi:hypothetical protein